MTAWATYGKVDGLYWMMINALEHICHYLCGTELPEPAAWTACAREPCLHGDRCSADSVRGSGPYNGGHLLWWSCLPRTSRSRPSVWICCISWFLMPLLPILPFEILSGTLRGGDAWMPLIITGIGVCAVRGAVDCVCSASLPHHHRRCLLLSFDLEPDHGCLCYLLLLFQQSQTLEA